MHLEAHAGLGWAIGVLAPGSDRRLRTWCLVAAILPDIDSASFLLGDVAYTYWHHSFGHNVLLGVLVAFAAAAHHRKRGAATGSPPRSTRTSFTRASPRSCSSPSGRA